MSAEDVTNGFSLTGDGGLRVLTFDRPEDMNAFTTEMLFSFSGIIDDLALDRDARVVILTGSGRAFTSGADFNHFVKSLDDPTFAIEVQDHARRTLRSIIDLPLPVIAAVNGPAVGFGATLATLCDIVLMSDRSFMSEPHVNIGLVVGDGISFSWPLYTSLLRAKELIFTGNRITPEQAVAYGLANRVVPADQLMTEARTLADQLIAQPPAALRESKKILNMHLRQSATMVLDTTLAAQYTATLSEEHHVLARAFLDRQGRRG